jgi:hypothetical protein
MDTLQASRLATLGHAVDTLSGDNSEEARVLRGQLLTAMGDVNMNWVTRRTEEMLRVAESMVSREEDFAPWPAGDPDRLDVLADELEELRLRIWDEQQLYQ